MSSPQKSSHLENNPQTTHRVHRRWQCCKRENVKNMESAGLFLTSQVSSSAHTMGYFTSRRWPIGFEKELANLWERAFFWEACYEKNHLKVDIWKHFHVYVILFVLGKNPCVTYKNTHIRILKEMIKNLLKSLLNRVLVWSEPIVKSTKMKHLVIS